MGHKRKGGGQKRRSHHGLPPEVERHLVRGQPARWMADDLRDSLERRHAEALRTWLRSARREEALMAATSTRLPRTIDFWSWEGDGPFLCGVWMTDQESLEEAGARLLRKMSPLYSDFHGCLTVLEPADYVFHGTALVGDPTERMVVTAVRADLCARLHDLHEGVLERLEECEARGLSGGDVDYEIMILWIAQMEAMDAGRAGTNAWFALANRARLSPSVRACMLRAVDAPLPGVVETHPARGPWPLFPAALAWYIT